MISPGKLGELKEELLKFRHYYSKIHFHKHISRKNAPLKGAVAV
jgi:hypothetical protein